MNKKKRVVDRATGSSSVRSCTVELDFAKRGVHLLVEKPISIRPMNDVQTLVAELAKEAESRKLVIAVGYMLRYNAAVTTTKSILSKV